MICPPMSVRADASDVECARDNCAWWHGDRGLCAVLVIASEAHRANVRIDDEYEREQAMLDAEAMRRSNW